MYLPSTESRPTGRLKIGRDNRRFEQLSTCRTCAKQRNGTGVLLFTYGVEKHTFEYFADQAVEAARLFKHHSPEIPLAIATSFDHQGFDVFDYVTIIREDHHFPGSNYENRTDGHKRQYLTRILYLTSSPFEVTLAYDTNVVSCGPLLPELHRLGKTDFDLAVASTGPGSHIIPHNWAIAYRWSKDVSSFFDEWFLQQVYRGVALNDQGTLRQAVNVIKARRKNFKFGTLNPAIA